MNDPAQQLPRTYKGVSLEERKAERRQRLIQAAVQVYAELGYRNASVKRVCQAAGLTERYFYESFENSEALFVAAYNAITLELLELLEQATADHAAQPRDRVRALLKTYFSTLQSRPAEAKVFLVEIRGVSQQMDDTFNASLHAIVEMGMELLVVEATDRHRMLALGVIAGVTHIATAWIKQGYTPDIEVITDAGMDLGMGLLQLMK